MNGDGELDPFTEALREDLPSAHDEARLRVRLASAGILAGAGVMTPAATAAATGTATAGVFAKLVALPLAVKVGATLALAGVAVVPLVHARGPALRTPVEAPARAAVLSPRTAEALPRAEVTPSPEARTPAPPADTTTSTVPARVEASSAPVLGLATRTPKRGAAEVAPVRDVGGGPVAAAISSAPAVAAFPAAPTASEDEGTLRDETAVMERALAAMKQGDFGAARRELALHAARFPNGHLAPERDRALARIREKEMTP
jgi:hypothetical protein